MASPTGPRALRRYAGSLLLVLGACGRESELSAGGAAALAGRYAGGGLLDFELRPDGSYEGFVLANIDGYCGTVEGNGPMTGRWRLEDGVLEFTPESEVGFGGSKLALSLAGATAVPTDEGLRIRAGARELRLGRRSE